MQSTILLNKKILKEKIYLNLKIKIYLRPQVTISFILNRDPLGVGGGIHENFTNTNDY